MTIRFPKLLVPGVAALLLVAACGDTRTERVATGALGGAAAGQIVAGEPIAGTAIGAAGGALLP